MTKQRVIIIGCCTACVDHQLRKRELHRAMPHVFAAWQPHVVERGLRGYRYTDGDTVALCTSADTHDGRIDEVLDLARVPIDAIEHTS